ncbi:hypothetical protein [Nocardioides mesophilus]|uniref:hypothetical protein n=1 Tax=Nocardioides mesophilus TaxID=433659 RepID=UPI001CB75583|nr:hypothetical protein [Nocardioides mesophilus]
MGVVRVVLVLRVVFVAVFLDAACLTGAFAGAFAGALAGALVAATLVVAARGDGTADFLLAVRGDGTRADFVAVARVDDDFPAAFVAVPVAFLAGPEAFFAAAVFVAGAFFAAAVFVAAEAFLAGARPPEAALVVAAPLRAAPVATRLAAAAVFPAIFRAVARTMALAPFEALRHPCGYTHTCGRPATRVPRG